MLRSLAFVPILLTVAAVSCNGPRATSEVRAAATGEPFTLALGESVEVAGHSLRFVDVAEDSRCPIGATCVWEGRAKVTLSASGPDGPEDRHVLTLPYSAMTDDESDTWEVGGLTVHLRDLRPFPEADRPADPQPEVELSVSATD
ncbi:MAG: hypothetical protein AAF791_02035 [Bacteroidota bacterium]